MVKNLPANAEYIRDMNSISGSGKSSAGGNDNPLQYSCLENLMDWGSWRVTVHGGMKSCSQSKWLRMHTKYTLFGYLHNKQRLGSLCWMVCLGNKWRSFESLGPQRDPTSPSKRRSVLDVHWKDWCWSWNSIYFGHLMWRVTHWKRPWC